MKNSNRYSSTSFGRVHMHISALQNASFLAGTNAYLDLLPPSTCMHSLVLFIQSATVDVPSDMTVGTLLSLASDELVT